MLRTYKHKLLIKGVKNVEFEYIICQEEKKKIKKENENNGYSACVVYTKTIIHLIIGESGEYLPRHFTA